MVLPGHEGGDTAPTADIKIGGLGAEAIEVNGVAIEYLSNQNGMRIGAVTGAVFAAK